jgi:O-antigen/teichoic acid export membrane protein
MTDYSANNKRIAKNTLFLYFRMIITMLVTLFTSRVVLDALGEDNYGIYNVVGGFVAMFSIFSGPLCSAIQRFLNFEIGKGNADKLRRIFSTAVNIQIIMSVFLTFFSEVVGLWFVYHKMTIPTDRIHAAVFVLQFSIATFVVNLISIPYNADIIAHEKMSAFAFISILEVMLKLAIAYCIYITGFDKLIIYSLLLFIVSLVLRFIYGIYCTKHFEEARYSFIVDRVLTKEMFSFAAWNFFGNAAWMFNTQGVNLLINSYFGLTANAARAIAEQVNGAVTQFVNNFMTAMNPQITKSYAVGDKEYLYSLNCRGVKYSFFIIYIFVVPIVLETATILKIWLVEVPFETATFLRLVLFATIATVIGNPLYTSILSTGKIQHYQIAVSSIGFLVFPLSWIAYYFDAPAYSTYVFFAIAYLVIDFVRLGFAKKLLDFPVKRFLKEVYLKIFICSFTCFFAPGLVILFIDPSFWRLILTCFVSFAWSLGCFYLLGLNKNERVFFSNKILSFAKSYLAKR